MRSGKRLSLLWFVMGLGSQLQIFFSLSITECIVVALFPFCFLQTYTRMRRNFLLVLMWLAFSKSSGAASLVWQIHAIFSKRHADLWLSD